MNLTQRKNFLNRAVALTLILSIQSTQLASLVFADNSKDLLQCRYKKLVNEIRKHDEFYYQKSQSEISDAQYDNLIRELNTIESKHPEWVRPDSPTKKVGSNLKKNKKTFPHASPMLSIQNTDQIQGLFDFDERASRLLGKQIEYYVEEKIDGAAVSLQYENGIFVRALTRGNGQVGNDATNLIHQMGLIPMMLKGRAPKVLEVRGEFYLPKEELVKLNDVRKKQGKKLFANPRNAAAGFLNTKFEKNFNQSSFQVMVYAIGKSSEPFALTQAETIQRLEAFGFPVNPHNQLCSRIEKAIQIVRKLEKNCVRLPYEIDGIVIKINNLNDSAALGATEKFPLGMIAYKFSQRQAETVLKDVILQVGRTGLITPVAILEPVWLDGSMISRTTLHNERIIESLGISIGDTVLIEKRGKVIPKIVAVTKKGKNLKRLNFKDCPSCKETYAKRNGKYYCESASCSGRLKASVQYFTGKSGMNISGFGPALIETLVDFGLVKRLSDLYKLNSELLVSAGISSAVSKKLLDQIEESKRRDFFRFINGLGILHVGISKAKPLAIFFEDLETFKTASYDELRKVSGVGDLTAKSIMNYLNVEQNQIEMEKFQRLFYKSS